MILTLIFLGLVVAGAILVIIDKISYKKYHGIWETIYKFDLDAWGAGLIILGGCLLGIALTVIVATHIGIDNFIQQDNIQYESLCKRLEMIDSDYEDVSKTEVIKDIAEWNADVIDNQYWARNPWTSWFFSQKKVDNLKLIEY